MVSGREVPMLSGRLVRLEPLEFSHVAGAVRAACEDRSSYAYISLPRDDAAMTAYVGDLLRARDNGEVIPFAQVDASSALVVGMTRYLSIRTRPGRNTPYAVEIGGTWLAASAQRSGLNTEAKFLLLRHAFETWRVVRVDLKADNRNERSKTAIVRLGATFEGVLRHWQPSMALGEEDRYRDTAMFSMIDEEWPERRARLDAMLG